MNSHGGRLTIAAMGAMLLFTVPASITSADHGVDSMYRNPGQDNCREGIPRQDVCRADNINHTWFLSPGYSADMLNASVSAMNSWGTTDVNTFRESSLSYLVTDVHFWPDPALQGTTTLGNVDCLKALDWLRCNAYNARIRPDVYTGGYNLAKAVICHEAGHTLGLLHGSDSVPQVSDQQAAMGCMRTDPLTGAMRFPGTHNLHQLNSAY